MEIAGIILFPGWQRPAKLRPLDCMRHGEKGRGFLLIELVEEAPMVTSSKRMTASAAVAELPKCDEKADEVRPPQQSVRRSLHDASHFARRVADAVPNILYIFDLVENRIVYCNQQVKAVLGYEPETILRMDSVT